MSTPIAGACPGAGEAGTDPRRWRALAVCLIVGFMTLLDVSIVNVALPSIRTGLHATADDLQWVLSGYALTFGLVLVPAGRLGDVRGRRAPGSADAWRWIFYVNVPVGVVALPLAYRLIPGGPGRAKTRRSLDPVGVGLLGAGVVLVLLPLVEAQQWHGHDKWALAAAGLGVLTGFVGWERRYGRRGQEPLADLTLFRVRSYVLGVVLALLYFAGFTAIFFMFTPYLQTGLGYSALLAGVAITPFALGSSVAAAVGGRTVARYGRPLVAAGIVLVALGLAGTYAAVDAVPGNDVAIATLVPLLVAGVGSGLVIAPNQTITLSEVPVRGGGSAAGVLQTGQRVGSAVGIAAVGSIFFSSVSATRGNWAGAFRYGPVVVLAFVAAALIVALVGLVGGHRLGRPA